jgi:hypothetical protein
MAGIAGVTVLLYGCGPYADTLSVSHVAQFACWKARAIA